MATSLPNRDWRLPEPRPAWRPSDNNLLAANRDPGLCASQNQLAAATHFFHRVWIPAETIITNLHLVVGATVGVNVVGYYMAVWETDLTRSGVSAPQTTIMHTAGFKTFALSAPVAAQKQGRWVFIGMVFQSASTAPGILTLHGASGVANYNLAAGAKRNGYKTGIGSTPVSPLADSNFTDWVEYWVGVT